MLLLTYALFLNHRGSSSDIALIKNNAMVGSQIARELARLRQSRRNGPSSNHNNNSYNNNFSMVKGHDDPSVRSSSSTADDRPPVVIGASIVDLLATSHQVDIEVSVCKGVGKRGLGGGGGL